MTAATETVRDSVYQGPDDTSAGLIMTLESHVKEYKGLKSQLDAADGDREAALQNYIENSDDAQAVKLRDQLKSLTERLRTLAEKNVQEVQLSDEDREKINTELSVHEEKINASVAAVKKVAPLLELDVDGVMKALEVIGNPTKGTRGRPKGSTGSSVPRASVNIILNGGTFKDQPAETFSALAKMLNCDVEYLSKEFAVAAGVDYENISQVDTPQQFMVQPKEDGPKYTINTTPKSRKPRSDSKKAEVTGTATESGPAEGPDFSDAASAASE